MATSSPSGLESIQEPLTGRERDVLSLLARGMSNAQIAETLFLSTETVRTHVKRIYRKIGARHRAHAVVIAYENGLIPDGRPQGSVT